MVLVTKKTKRASTARPKQRDGRHHKKDGHYLKAYWPYLPMVLIVVLGLAFSSLWGHMQHGVLGYATGMSDSGLLQGTNDQRAGNGLGGLAYNSLLAQAAQAKANDMASRNYWSHNTPDGATPWTFINNAGYSYQTAGENLAYGFDNSDATITAWMNSPDHRANILNSTYKEVGFGIANSADYQSTGPETIVVAMYGSARAPAPAPAPVTPKPAVTKPTAAAPTTETPAAETPTPTPAPDASQQATQNKPKDTNAVANTGAVKPPAANKDVSTKNVSRIQLITNGQAPWSMFAVSTLATVAIAVFILRHALFWHRALVKGESFFIRHKFFDFTLIAVGVVAYVLTRSAGVIH
jgi:cell division septation protein DedD